MGRSYQAEPWVQQHLDGLLQRKVLAEVGLLVGKEAVGARDLILGIVPTPPQDGQEAVRCTVDSGGSSVASGKGRKAPGQASGAAGGPAAVTAATLDVAWIGQHAEQVSRMLPGGLCLLGCYLFCSDAGYQSCLPQLWTVLQDVRRIRGLTAPASGGPELVVIHADAARKVTARSSPASGPTPSALTIAELKWAACTPNLMQLSCSWPLNCALPVAATTTSLQQQMDELIQQQCVAIGGALAALSDNVIPAPEASLLDVLSPTNSTGGLPCCTVQLFPLQGTPGSDTAGPEASSSGSSSSSSARGPGQPVAVCGHGRLRGWQSGLAVVHKRQAWASAITELKADLCASLRVRLDILVEDALSWEEEGQGEAPQVAGQQRKQHPLVSQHQPLARPFATALPRRVTQLALGGLPVCDYLLDGEGVSDAEARVTELLVGPRSGTEQQVTELESAPTVAKKLPAWSPWAAVTATAVPAQARQPTTQCSSTILGGAAVGLAVGAAALAVMFSNMTT